MKKITTYWKPLGAILLVAALIFCLTGAVPQVREAEAAPATAPETASATAPDMSPATVYTYRGYSAAALGLTDAMAQQLASYSEAQSDAYMTAFLLAKYNAEMNERTFDPETEADAIAADQAMLLDGSLDAESVRIRKLKADCYLRAQGKSAAEAAALWEAFDAQAAGFDTVEAYRAWKTAWKASITPTEAEIAAWEQQDAQNEQARRDANGGYMGCDPNGP